MKLVQINAVNKFGSTGRNTAELHSYCKLHRIDSYVFCMNESNKRDNIYFVGTNIDHKFHALCSRLFGLQGYFSCNATKKLLSQLDRIKPDVVFLGNLHSNFVNFPMLCKYLAEKDIATVFILHDCWFFTGHCTHYTSFKCYKWQSKCKKCLHIKSGNPSLFFDTSEKVFNDRLRLYSRIPRLGIIGVSDWITNEARKSVLLNSAKSFSRIYNWVDMNIFYPRETNSLKEKIGILNEFVVLGVATEWSYMKGFLHYIEAAKRLPEVKFILIGRVSNNVHLPTNVYTPGLITDVNELAEYYSLADVLLVCSLQETFGKVSAEAMACGTPIVANNVTANPEISGEECGIIINNNNDDEIECALRHIMKVGKDYYFRNCITRAHIEFSMNTQLLKYIRFAKSLLKE